MILLHQASLIAILLLIHSSFSFAAVTVSLLESGSHSVREGSRVQICVKAEGDSEQNFEVRIEVQNVNTNRHVYQGVVELDYYVLNDALTFDTFSGSDTQCSLIYIINDGIYEGEETFVVTIKAADSIEVNPDAQSAMFHIIDINVVSVGFRESSLTLGEGERREVCVIVKGVSERPFTIRIYSLKRSHAPAATAEEDYETINLVVEVAAFRGKFQHCLSVVTLEDTLLEDLESFFLILVPPSFANSTELPIHILDNDVVTVRFAKAALFVEEDAGSVPLLIVMSDYNQRPVTILFSAYGVAARPGTDFEPQRKQEIIFQPGQKTVTHNVTIIDDREREGNEGFTARLTSRDDGVASESVITILIFDND